MKNRYPDLAKQVVFITGAASGIGAAQAQAFLEQDAFVFGLDQKFGKMEELSFRFPVNFCLRTRGCPTEERTPTSGIEMPKSFW